VSNRLVKRIRYSLLLPLLHLAIAAPPIFRQEVRLWDYLAHAQLSEDYVRDHPVAADNAMQPFMNPCYEYRASAAERLTTAADLPTAFLIGSSARECAPGATKAILNKFKYRLRVKTRVILISCLMVLGIFFQWLLLGVWLDRVRKHAKAMYWWFTPIAVITLAGMLMAPAAFASTSTAEMIGLPGIVVSLLAWFVLFGMFLVLGVKALIRRLSRPQDATPVATP
jgi:hypothetical protein